MSSLQQAADEKNICRGAQRKTNERKIHTDLSTKFIIIEHKK